MYWSWKLHWVFGFGFLQTAWTACDPLNQKWIERFLIARFTVLSLFLTFKDFPSGSFHRSVLLCLLSGSIYRHLSVLKAVYTFPASLRLLYALCIIHIPSSPASHSHTSSPSYLICCHLHIAVKTLLRIRHPCPSEAKEPSVFNFARNSDFSYRFE